MEKDLERLKYPIGRFALPSEVSVEEIHAAIGKIRDFPAQLLEVVKSLQPDQLDTPYRPGGWTIRQVVHHLADSHMNAFIRFKLALTEEAPVIKPYEEDKWAEQADYNLGPEFSLVLIGSLHKRWVTLMESMTNADWDRTFTHPQYNRVQKLSQTVMLYAWHGEHHLGHILNAEKLKG